MDDGYEYRVITAASDDEVRARACAAAAEGWAHVETRPMRAAFGIPAAGWCVALLRRPCVASAWPRPQPAAPG